VNGRANLATGVEKFLFRPRIDCKSEGHHHIDWAILNGRRYFKDLNTDG